MPEFGEIADELARHDLEAKERECQTWTREQAGALELVVAIVKARPSIDTEQLLEELCEEPSPVERGWVLWLPEARERLEREGRVTTEREEIEPGQEQTLWHPSEERE